jgi:ABC-2 type transport system permease protein
VQFDVVQTYYPGRRWRLPGFFYAQNRAAANKTGGFRLNKILCYLKMSKLCASQAFDGGIAYVISGYGLRLVRLVILLMVWRSLLQGGADTGGLTLAQVLTYTLISSVFTEQLDVVTPATTAFWEGSLLSRYTRPLPVMMQLISETAGKWLPSLLMYSLPMLVLAPLFGIQALPASLLSGLAFALSLVLAVALGFSMDFLFAALAVRLKNASWMAYTIRNAIVNLFSGVLIPFALLPWGIGGVLGLLPFGSLGSAPLSIYVGSGNALELLLVQLAWNAILWPFALLAFGKSQERMVSYGG